MEENEVEDVIVSFISVFSVMAFLANSSVLFLVITSKPLRTFVNGFVVSLALSDILLSIALYSYLGGLHRTGQDRVEEWPRFVIGIASLSELGNLCAVTYERYLAVVKPFQYKVRIRKYFTVVIPLNWFFSVSLSSLVFIPLDSLSTPQLHLLTGAIALLFVVVPFVIIVVFYCYIFASLVKQKRTIHNIGSVHQNGSAHQHNKSEEKLVKMFAVVASLYIFSTIPALLNESVKKIQKFTLPGCTTSFAILFFLAALVFSSLANPFIYTFTKQDFRQQVKKTFRKISCHIGNRVQPS